MKYGYSFQKEKKDAVKALGRDVPISFKQSIEICNYIRGDTVIRAKAKLEDAISKSKPIPFKRFTNGVGHRRGNDVVAGRYPIKACTQILKIVNSAVSNALFKGLNSKGLIIEHLSAKQAPVTWHYGRQQRRQAKRCHVEVILKEAVVKKQDKKEKVEAIVKEVKPKVEETQPKVETAQGVETKPVTPAKPNPESSQKDIPKETIKENKND